MSYTIKILSRNLSNPSQIDETDITSNVLSGFSFVEKLDESLDIGSMTIKNVDRFQPYDLFDTIEVYEDSVVKFSMRISSDSVRLVSKSPLKYEHQVGLVEHTKILERFLISGKTFTQPTDGSTTYSLYDTINILNNTTPYEQFSLVSSTRVHEMPTGSLATYLQGIPSPEFTFKDVTLREAYNQVCGYVEGIPRLVRESDGTLRLTIDFVDEPNSLIDASDKVITKMAQQDSEYYATSIVSEAQNLVSENDINEAVEYYPADGTWITPRSDDYVFQYAKSHIQTPKRIYNVNKLEHKVFANCLLDSAYVMYDYSKKFYYYATVGDFPTTGTLSEVTPTQSIYYVDVSSFNQTYIWNGSSYIVSGTQADATNPKIRLYETYSDFVLTGGRVVIPAGTFIGEYQYDIYVDLSTQKVYRVNDTGNGYQELNKFDNNGNLILDLTDRVYERNNWNALPESGSNRTNPSNFYKSNTLVYDYRKNNIQLGTTSGLFDTGVDIDFIQQIKIFEDLQSEGLIPSSASYTDTSNSTSPGTFGAFAYYNFVLMRVHYTPILQTQRMNIDRQDISNVFYQSEITANQQARSINLEFFANNLQGRINRIGNSELELNNKILTLGSTHYYSLKDYTDDDFIVTERETIIFKDYCYVKYGLTKNYNIISKFIGVNSEIRQYEMGEQDNLSRVLTSKEYCEIDIVANGNGSNTSSFITFSGVSTLLETLNPNSEKTPVRGGYLRLTPPTQNVLAPFSSNGSGNTLMFFQQLNSNVALDQRSQTYSSTLTKEFVKYASSNGTATSMVFNLFDRIVNPELYLSEQIYEGDSIPEFSSSQIKTSYFNSPVMLVEKDNRERIGNLHNLHITSSDINKVIIGRRFITRNRLVNENPPTQLKFYAYDGVTLDKTNNLTPKSGWDSITTLIPSDVTIDAVNEKITISSTGSLSGILTSGLSAWIITDENDEVLFGVNQNETLLNVITFDFTLRRNGIKYKY